MNWSDKITQIFQWYYGHDGKIGAVEDFAAYSLLGALIVFVSYFLYRSWNTKKEEWLEFLMDFYFWVALFFALFFVVVWFMIFLIPIFVVLGLGILLSFLGSKYRKTKL